jgi:hypothetical protein
MGSPVFGGEHLREWTVMNGNEHSTFLNPPEALYDRLAAVRLLAGDVPVGYGCRQRGAESARKAVRVTTATRMLQHPSRDAPDRKSTIRT